MNVLPWHQNPAICKRCRLGIEKCGFRQSKKQGERTAVKKAVLPFFLALQWLQRCSLAFWPFGLLAFWPSGCGAPATDKTHACQRQSYQRQRPRFWNLLKSFRGDGQAKRQLGGSPSTVVKPKQPLGRPAAAHSLLVRVFNTPPEVGKALTK